MRRLRRIVLLQYQHSGEPDRPKPQGGVARGPRRSEGLTALLSLVLTLWLPAWQSLLLAKGSPTNYCRFQRSFALNHLPLPYFLVALVDTALERTEAGLYNAVSTSAREWNSGERLAGGSQL